MEAALRALAIILEMIGQAVKARSEDERQQRIDYARNNPADYLRRFGRVRDVSRTHADAGADAMRSGKTDD
ncbi:hypothetical protein F3E67_20690 [Salmonella enterica subsp. salamae]|nr:hypothetical protein [Salmonella enterica subsp. enterica serovar Typhimurium]ECW0140722.1 hypothetical protein [Salmonella enterica subsp. salamae]EDR0193572.1 hypothetical protein [Salmonella enterica subsp. houtenae]